MKIEILYKRETPIFIMLLTLILIIGRFTLLIELTTLGLFWRTQICYIGILRDRWYLGQIKITNNVLTHLWTIFNNQKYEIRYKK